MTVSLTGALTDSGSVVYDIRRMDKTGIFCLEGKPWSIVEQDAEENQEDLGFELTIKGRVLKPDMKNINPAMLAQVDPNSKLVDDLKEVEKLKRDKDNISKVYMAMNAWVRNIHNEGHVSTHEIDTMIQATKHEGELSDEDKRNPIKRCWNDQLSQKTVEKLVKAIGQINREYLDLHASYQPIRKIAFKDPLLSDSLLRERVEQSTEVPSTVLAKRFIKSIEFLLFRIQDSAFDAAEKPPTWGESRIECDLHRFKASQVAVEGKCDHGDGDTLFSQVFKEMKRKQPNNW